MNKIPLENTIGAAYKFLFTRILSILGTLWLPALIMGALFAGVLYAVVPQAWWHGQFPAFAENNPDPAALWALIKPIVMAYPLLVLVGIVVGSMMTVGLMQLSLGQKERCYVFFSLEGDVWRLILAHILATIIIILIIAVTVGIVVAAAILAKPHMPHGAWILSTIVLGIAAACCCIYAQVRLCFFIPGVVVAEHRIGLGRSWELGGGNFWRIVLIFLVITIPVGIVAGMIQNMTVMPIMASQLAPLMHGKPNPADVVAFFKALPPLIPIFVAVGLLQQIAIPRSWRAPLEAPIKRWWERKKKAQLHEKDTGGAHHR